SALWLTFVAAVVMAVTGVLCRMGPMWRPLLALPCLHCSSISLQGDEVSIPDSLCRIHHIS
ncbi:hypothetical protein M9458_044121, partial [Cirrhinus mrigala]